MFMEKTFRSEKIPLIIIFAIFLIAYILSWGRMGDVTIDCGREAYIPLAIADGKLLYKDIFCLYGPLPYLFNAFFFKIFGGHLGILYFIGGALGVLYTLGTYLCSREFLSKTISTFVTLTVIFACVFGAAAFNFIFPYSFAASFAATFSIWILYSLLRYLEFKDIRLLYFAFILWGAVFASKADYILVIIPIIILFCIYEKDKIKKLPQVLIRCFALPLFCTLILILQGVRVQDYLKNFQYISKMMDSESIINFFACHRIMIFNANSFVVDLINFALFLFMFGVFFAITLWAFRKNNKFLVILIPSLGVVALAYLVLTQISPGSYFALLPYFCFILFVYKCFKCFKSHDFKNPKSLKILTLLCFAVLFSIKCFHCLNLNFYGAFVFAPLYIAFVWFILHTLENNLLFNTRKHCEIAVIIFVSIFMFIYLADGFSYHSRANTVVKTSHGLIKTTKQKALAMNELIKYIDKDKSVAVLPEGLMVNFLTGSKWNFYNTTFLPIDFDTFGEDYFIESILDKKPDYILFAQRNSFEYGKKTLCKDYGNKLCSSIFKEYGFEAVFGDKYRIHLFSRKK